MVDKIRTFTRAKNLHNTGGKAPPDMHVCFRCFFTFSLLSLFFLFGVGYAEEQEPVVITADEISHENKTGQAVAKGSVSIRYKDRVITGDEASYNIDTGAGSIEGNVVYRDQKSRIYCQRADINVVTGLGELYRAEGDFSGRYFFAGEKIERIEESRYLILNGQVTSCPQKKPHWSFHAGAIDLTTEEYARMSDVSFRVGRIPVFYLPYLVAPVDTKRKTGFLIPVAGYSDRRGAEIGNAFFWAIAQNADATFGHKYYSDIGNEFTGEFRYIFAPQTFGSLNVKYLLEDNGDQIDGRELWKIDFDHRQELPLGITNRTRIDKESDESIDREYGDNVADRTKRYADSYTSFSRSWALRNLTATVRERATVGGEEGEQLLTIPEVTFENPSQPILGEWLYGALSASGVTYKLTEDIEDDPYEVTRLSIEPTLSLPVSLAPWLSITAKAGYRALWYSTLADEDNRAVDESLSISYYKTGLTLTGPKLFRIFETGSLKRPRIKNLITPTISWSYISGYEEEEGEPVVRVFDALDNFAPANRVTYQLVSEVLAKDVTDQSASTTVQLMRLVLSQTYDLDEADREDDPDTEKRPFSSAVIDLDTRVYDGLMFNVKAYYDPYDLVWSSVQTEIGVRVADHYYFGLDRVFSWGGEDGDDTVWDTAYIEYNAGGGVSFDYSIIYDEVAGEIHDSIFRTRYIDDCWSVALNISQQTVSITDDDGTESTEEEFSAILTITLKGIGDLFGREKKPLVGRKL